jgi:hypothetical protein
MWAWPLHHGSIAGGFRQALVKLSPRDVPYTDPASICPVCASEPVASVIRIGGKVAGHRYALRHLCLRMAYGSRQVHALRIDQGHPLPGH